MRNALQTYLGSIDGYVALSRDFDAAVNNKVEAAGVTVSPDHSPKFER